ncbi:MAG: hypothetical protein CMJ85_12715 [Planctomycetes bacterium]|nr:hypothetical protein [Planctomycetota bacterium]
MEELETLESMLLPQDLVASRAIHCLACQKEVGKVAFLGDDSNSDERYRLVSLSVNSEIVQGVVGSRAYVRFACDCGKASLYHLML